MSFSVPLRLFPHISITSGGLTAGNMEPTRSERVEAKITINLGEPYYDQRMGPDYRYYKGRGWYRYNNHRRNISCGQAKRIVRDHGFRNVSTREREGRTCKFVAKRNGHHTLVYVNSRIGSLSLG